MIFFKTVTGGNSFLQVRENETGSLDASARRNLVIKMCQDEAWQGADGMVFYQPEGETVSFRIFNKDGREAELSGNGMAGAAAVLFYSNPGQPGRIKLQTRVGIKTVTLLSRSEKSFELKIEIGEPDFHNLSFFPFLKENQLCYSHLNHSFYPVSVGNPHIVLLLDHDHPEDTLIPAAVHLSSARIFPMNTNVEFVFQTSPKDYRVLFFERGVGKTLFSSTGSAAVYAVLRQLSRITDRLLIKNPQGAISVTGFPEIHIENKTEIVYKGIYER